MRQWFCTPTLYMNGRALASEPKVPCRACACSGSFVDYGGPGAPAVLVPCKKCGGSGWVARSEGSP